MIDMLLPDLLTASAERFPDKTALIFPTDKISFGVLDQQSNQVAARLRRLGIGDGDRVAIVHENALSAVVFFWGILKTGAQTVDIPCLSGSAAIEKMIRECTPAALVASERQLQRLFSVGGDYLPKLILTQRALTRWGSVSCHSLEEITITENDRISQSKARGWDVAMLVYTSGTTGEPKGVMLSHRNLLSNINSANSLMRLTSEDSILLVVPLHFIHGRMQLLTHTLIGGTIAFSSGFQFPQQIVAELAQHRVTGFSGVPYHFTTLLDRTSFAKAVFPDLRYVVVTGGSLPTCRLHQLSESLPGVAIHIAYGQTEASPRITSLKPSDVLSKPTSCGVPLPGLQVDILDDSGSTTSIGEPGEIVVSGPNVMCGYVSGDEYTSGKIDAFGRLHTGDLGKVDNKGCLYVIGRKSELIKSAGERIFPREIEFVLDAHPAIQESAVLGLPDDTLGERIVACVVLDSTSRLSSADIRTHCLRFLPLVRVPREVRFSAELPKTSSGKIDRHKLAAHFNQIGLNRHQQAA